METQACNSWIREASLLDLLNGRIVLHNKGKLMHYYFDNVNCLIEAGWAID